MQRNESSQVATSDERESKGGTSGVFWLLAVFLASLGLWGWLLANQTPAPTRTPTPPDAVPTPSASDGDQVGQQLFDQNVEPLLEECRRANKKAVEAFLVRVEQSFDGYRAGVPGFAEELMGLRTRFGVLWRMPVNWLKKNDKVETYVRGKFEKHVFSERQMTEDMTRSFQHLREDLHANRNRLVARTKSAVSQSDIQLPSVPNYAGYETEMREIMTEFIGDRAKDSVYSGLVTLLVSETGTLVVERILSQVGMTIASAAVQSTAAAGGTTATTTAASGGTGSLGGPVGTAIGVGVGLVVGFGIDWWMSSKFEDKLEKDMTAYVQRLERDLLEGTEERVGLRTSLQRFLDSVDQAESDAMHTIIAEVSK